MNETNKTYKAIYDKKNCSEAGTLGFITAPVAQKYEGNNRLG